MLQALFRWGKTENVQAHALYTAYQTIKRMRYNTHVIYIHNCAQCANRSAKRSFDPRPPSSALRCFCADHFPQALTLMWPPSQARCGARCGPFALERNPSTRVYIRSRDGDGAVIRTGGALIARSRSVFEPSIRLLAFFILSTRSLRV